MTSTQNNTSKQLLPSRTDPKSAEIALQRAAKLARERAARFGLGVMIWKDGKIVEEK